MVFYKNATEADFRSYMYVRLVVFHDFFYLFMHDLRPGDVGLIHEKFQHLRHHWHRI